MKFYADAPFTGEPRQLLADIGEGMGRGAAAGHMHERRQRSIVIDALREALIAAGMLEQGLADLQAGGGEMPDRLCVATLRSVMRIADRCADSLWSAYGGEALPSRDIHALSAIDVALDTLGPLAIALPEGYLFYGLFPELYTRLGLELAARLRDRPVVVIGVRSIGTSLSAALAAGLRAGGCATERYTVRPTGDPFARLLVPPVGAAQAWRRAAARGAAFVAVDEGPGLSGSSLAAVVNALERLGAEGSRIHIACATAPRHLPMATAETRALWQRTRWLAIERLERDFWLPVLADLLGDMLGQAIVDRRDVSWGGWAALEGAGAEHALTLPQLERRKLLLGIGRGTVVAKFVGFGQTGREKAGILRQLAAADLVPPFVEYAHGMALQAWLAPQPMGAPAHPPEPPVAAAACYYAYLRRQCAAPETPDLAELAGWVQQIARDWFGEVTAPDALNRYLGQMRDVRPLHGDQRPEQVEWIVHDGRVFKCDAGDHFLDHSWARSQDVCFDIAGFSMEFALHAGQQRELLAMYARESGDAYLMTRLPFFEAVYAAHRLAALDTAYHAGAADRGVLDRKRRRMAATLGRTLRIGGGAACVS